MLIEHKLSHAETWELVPWLINGTASREDRTRVEEHLKDCADCRNEYAWQCQLYAGIGAALDRTVISEPHAALQRLHSRIDTAETQQDRSDRLPLIEAAAPKRGTVTLTVQRRWFRALVAAAVVQAIGIALLGGFLSGQGSGFDTGSSSATPSAPYVTLSSAPQHAASAATIRFVPSPTMTLGQLQATLEMAQLHVVESSANNTVYGLANKPASEGSEGATGDEAVLVALARLRSQPGVLLAEPIARYPTDSH